MDIVALAPRTLERPLLEEVGSRLIEQRGRLFLLSGKEIPLWAQNVWLEPQTFQFKSISEAAKHLRSIQRNWWLHSSATHRRAHLIQEALPPFKHKRVQFPSL